MIKKIALVGATGSIGRQVIEVALSHPQQFQIVAMCAQRSAQIFQQQLWQVQPAYAALADSSAAQSVTEVPQGTQFLGGEDAALAVAAYAEADIVVVAATGFAGLKYSLAAIGAGKSVALANKETLVCGGDLVMPLVQQKGLNLLPVDSEHSAIWQCLNFDRAAHYQNLIITASGGAFRGKTRQELLSVTPEQALCHPTWQMGAKITIDCATLLNKGYEVIEAHHLFGAEYSQIKTVIHPQSIVHSMVQFEDGAVLAQLGVPSMKVPIQMALTYPNRLSSGVPAPDFAALSTLQFMPLERKNFPCYDMALACGEQGGILPCVCNAAAEVSVHAFLNHRIGFLDIERVLDGVLSQTLNQPVTSYAQLAQADATARQSAEKIIRSLSCNF